MMLISTLFVSGTYAQYAWESLIDGRVAVPRIELEQGIAIRMLLDTLYFEEQLENKAFVAALSAKDKEIATLKLQVEPVRAENFMLKNNLGVCQESIIKVNEKLASKKAWALIGQIETGAICIGVLVGGTVVILNALKP